MLIRTAHSTLTEQLAERFAERIRSRLLPAGARLPSVRDCARQQGVSPYTVVAAYDQLLAQGLVESRRQRGFYVRDLTQKEAQEPYGRAQAAIKNAANEERLAGPLDGPLPSGSHINATALIRGMFHQASSQPQPGAGVMPATWLEEARFMPAALRKVIDARYPGLPIQPYMESGGTDGMHYRARGYATVAISGAASCAISRYN